MFEAKMKKMKQIKKWCFVRKAIGPVKNFVTQMKKMKQIIKIVFVRKVIGPVKKFDA